MFERWTVSQRPDARFDRDRPVLGMGRASFGSLSALIANRANPVVGTICPRKTLLDARKGEARFYTDIADGLRASCRTDTEALTEMAQLHRRILFTILVSNNDDHLKNHGLLYAGISLSDAG